MKMGKGLKVKSVTPSVALKGGIIRIDFNGQLDAWDLEEKDVMLGNHTLRLIASASDRIVGEVLYFPAGQETLALSLKGEIPAGKKAEVHLPYKITENHIFGSSPVCDPLGNIYFIDLKELQNDKESVIYQYSMDTGKIYPYVSGISAPTSLAYFEGVLWVTSMVERKLYRCVGPGEFEVYSQGLGSVFGLAINSLGEIFVGDQTGSLFKVDSSGKASFYATIPETFKGYHFAFSPQDELFLSIPASVGKNCIYRINEKQETVPYLETMNILGGIAFSPEGQLYWVENSREEGIVYRMSAQGEKRKVVSAGFLLGIQFTPRGDLIITDLHNLYMVRREWLGD